MGSRQSRPWIVSDELWWPVEPLLPKPGPKKVQGRRGCRTGRPCAEYSSCWTPASGWEYLSQELGFGSGMTCSRRLAAWDEAGVWDQLHRLLLNELRRGASWTGSGR
ncbi:transposase [Streptomyces rochei]|uniref:transposase n=1 Tax=Streptomyces rochei TaxID=1928 RepID=UPI0037F89876